MSSIMREDWIECELGEICFTTSGGTPSRRNEAFYKGSIPWVKSGELDRGIIYDTEEHISEDAVKKSSAKIFPEGSLLIALYGATIGKLAFLGVEATTNQAICGIYKNEFIDSKYLYNFLLNRKQKLISQGTGGAQPNISQTILKKLEIPFAPLPIQRAIVSKIEALFSDLDNGIANFKKAQEQLKIYRQAVLKKAFEGELTKEWREGFVKTDGRPSQLPTAEELLKQIKEERQNHYNQQIEDWKKAVKEWEKGEKKGKRPSRISKPKELPNVKESDVETYENLPTTWQWSKFGNVTYKIGDIDHKMPKTVSNGYPYLSTGDLNKDGTIDFSGAKTISKEDFDRLALKIKPEKGDIIFPRYGTIGRNILIDFDKEFLVSYACAIIKNIKGLMSSKFALYYSLSPVIKKEIRRYTVETTQANIGIASIENFVFPLCSTEEQIQIVQEIESRLSVCDKMEQSIIESIAKAEALRQSILKKAFEGRLLSKVEVELCKKEADYEPASELLTRIERSRNEKIQAEKVKTNGRSSRPKKKSKQ
jgi:type I restriction enzyme, S subunit